MSVPEAAGPLARSYLYVPGDEPRFLDRARSRGADAVIVDLEDAVAAGRKAAARDAAGAWLERQEAGADEIWVRIDLTRAGEAAGADDGLALARFGCVTGIVVPKATEGVLDTVEVALTRVEQQSGRLQPVAVIALIESAAGLLSAPRIAARRRIRRLGVGRADLLAELGLDGRRVPSSALSSLWLQLVVASASAAIDAPIAPVHTDLHDTEALGRTTREFADLGFAARTAIHPAQLGVINDVFTPSAAQLEQARERVAWFEAAARAGSGVVVDPDGRMVDEAVIRAARKVLRRGRREGTDRRPGLSD